MRRQEFITGSLLPLALAGKPGLALAAGDPVSVTIAYQPGLAYAPLVLLKQHGTLEKAFPHTKIAWTSVSGGSAVRDGIIAGQIQLGVAGTAPFLIGWSHEPSFRILCGVSAFDIWLVSKDPSIKTIRDIKPGMKIGTPDLAGSNAIILQMACQREFGNPHQLDGNIQPMPHPQAVQALESGQIAAHFSTPPFQFEETAAGAHVILRSVDVIGPATFTEVLTTDSFGAQYPGFVTAFYRATTGESRAIKSNPSAAARELSASSNGKVTAAKMQSWLSHEATGYGTTPRGVLKYAAFMKQLGEIPAVPSSMAVVTLPELRNKGD